MHSSGLRCSHNSELDTKIPRAKLPKRALPDCLRKKLKGVKVDDTNDDDSNNVYQAGSGVLAPVGSAPDGTFLKRGTGVPMSHRASALAQRRGDAANARATIFRAARVDGTIQRNDDRTSIRWSKANEKRKEEMKNVKMGRENNKSGSTSLPPINNRSGNQSSMNKSKNQSSKQQREQDQFQPIPIKRNNKADNKRRPTQSQHLDAFLQSGNTPRLLSEGEALLQSKKMSKPKYQVKFDLVNDALYIMNQVNQTYGKTMGTEDNPIYGAGDLGYLEQFFGPTISNKAAKAWLDEYLIDNDIVGKVSIEWSNDGNQQNQDNEGVSCKYNESQDKLNIIVNNSFPGISRAFGIQMFAHHEISTRGMRILNDIHQPWATDRRSHGLASQGSRETGATEEGLASIHSMIGCNDPNHRYLWNIAVLYYACAMGVNMTFSELFDHLSTWISDRARRFNICCRVKRGVCCGGNNNSIGSSGQCQCYFEGAHAILTRVVNDPMIDLRELFFGKICLSDLDRAASIADKDYLLIPSFIGGSHGTNEDYNSYVNELKEIALLNGICHEN